MLIRFLSDALRAVVTHYGLWFREAEHQLADLDKAIELEDRVWENVLSSLFRRIANRLGVNLREVGG